MHEALDKPDVTDVAVDSEQPDFSEVSASGTTKDRMERVRVRGESRRREKEKQRRIPIYFGLSKQENTKRKKEKNSKFLCHISLREEKQRE